ncbi:MAG: hypothetical protein KDC44_03995, partial [Phaeodactylibacter sp.]|nr:hypothetical protein [Phaeodactylibacter sp.]
MTTRLLLIALALICCYTAFGQSLERALIKDSTAVEPLSPYLKKVLQSTAAHLEIPIEHLDTSTLTAHYRIWAYPSGVQYPVLLRKDLRSTL